MIIQRYLNTLETAGAVFVAMDQAQTFQAVAMAAGHAVKSGIYLNNTICFYL